MEGHDGQRRGVLLPLASFVVVVAGMHAAEAILVPFLLSIFIAVICAPPLFFLKRRGVPTPVALLLVAAGIGGLGIAVAALLAGTIDQFTATLPDYQARLEALSGALVHWLDGLGVPISGHALIKMLDPDKAMALAGAMVSRVGGLLANAFLILLTVIFLLFEASSLPGKLRRILPTPSGLDLEDLYAMAANVNRYMMIKTLVSLLTGVAVATWVALVGLDFPLLWGLLAFLFNYVPNIGSIIAAVPAILLALIQLGSGGAALVTAGYLVINVVISNAIEPRFMGRGLGLSTLVVFLSLAFWGWVLGPVGMLLSVPLTMSIKIALESRAQTRWIGILLGPEVVEEAPEAEPAGPGAA